MSELDILLLPVFLLITLVVAASVGSTLRLTRNQILLITAYHTLFSFIYYLYVASEGGDANGYYLHALDAYAEWEPGTKFVTSFTSLLAHNLGLGKLNVFLIYNLMGVVGLLILAHLVLLLAPRRMRQIALMIVLLPGLSFWSSAIGKDAPAFLAACLALYAFLDIKRRAPLFALAVALMFAVRPHMAATLLIAACLSLLFSSGLRLAAKAVLIPATATALFFSSGAVIEYVGLDELSQEAADEYVDGRAGLNQQGGGAVDIRELSMPAKLFTYLFRPLFFDARGLTGLISSAENLVLLGLILLGWRGLMRMGAKVSHPFVGFATVYFLWGWVMFALTTANLGIAVRQKTMILPALLVLLAAGLHHVALRGRRRRSAAHACVAAGANTYGTRASSHAWNISTDHSRYP